MAGLSEKTATAVIEFVFGPLSSEPFRLSKPLRLELDGLRVARRGAYRVIFSCEGEEADVVVHLVEHRSHIYRSSWHA